MPCRSPKVAAPSRDCGESFQADLHSGAGSYAVPLDLPEGPGDLAPALSLAYSTGSGAGPFGFGFDLPLFAIQRSVTKTVPRYDANDRLVLVGGGELVPVAPGEFRLHRDAHRWRIRNDGAGFQLADANGRLYRLGLSEQARLHDPAEPGRVFAWLIERVEDALGNTILYEYERQGGRLYLSRVAYGVHEVRFAYEARPDLLRDGSAGFLITTERRCRAIELHTSEAAPSLMRRWSLRYRQAAAADHSLLAEITLTGFDGTGASQSLPPLRLTYTEPAPRRLEPVEMAGGLAPPALEDATVQLLDWDGDGLVDLVEINHSRVVVWHNRGDLTFDPPRPLGDLPAPLALGDPNVAFADMEGNGTADLVSLDGRLDLFYPHRAKGGFAPPLRFRHAPSAQLGRPEARLVDLDGDRISDLLVLSPTQATLYLREPDAGWSPRPLTLPREAAPPVALDDPRVQLGDMNGDGLVDIVRIDGAGVRYWPYLGQGRWDAPVDMTNAPRLPRQFDPARLFLADVDGDGCADLIYVDATRVLVWRNGTGHRFADEVTIPFTPPAPPEAVELVDLSGTGMAGVLWSYRPPGRGGPRYLFLDLTGSTKPYLLSRINNGLGLETEVAYGVSTEDAARARGMGRPWRSFLPMPVPVIRTLIRTDEVTGIAARTDYRYAEGHFDGRLRIFMGFGQVEALDAGNSDVPAQLTLTHFHQGLPPEGIVPDDAASAELGALRGKPARVEVFPVDAAGAPGPTHVTVENVWVVDTPVAGVPGASAARLERSTTRHFDGAAEPWRIQRRIVHAVDGEGNVTDQEEIAEDPRDPARTVRLHTRTAYALDPNGRFRAHVARVEQQDGDARVLSRSVSVYDNLPEGRIGAQGLLTEQRSLVLTDDAVAEIYGAAPPDFTALGYVRLPGENGWWSRQVRYERDERPQAVLRGGSSIRSVR